MSKRVTYFNSSFRSILTPDQIFGENLYDWWDYTNESTQTIDTGLITNITSTGTNAGVMSSTGTSRPAQIVGINGLKVADFDGVNDFMQVAASTDVYNFLHDLDGGTVIVIGRVNDANPNSRQDFLSNNGSTTVNIGYGMGYEDRVFIPANNQIRNAILRGVSGSATSRNFSSDNAFLPQQYNLAINRVDGDAVAASRSIININGGVDIANNVLTNAASFADATFNLHIGQSGNNNNYLRGLISEVIILNSQITPTQVTQLTAYYLNKYGSPFPIV